MQVLQAFFLFFFFVKTIEKFNLVLVLQEKLAVRE